MAREIAEETFVMPNGKHAGKPITRVPVSYLKWMVNAGHSYANLARRELERRGTVTPELEITGHAIDRASQKLLGVWGKSRHTNARGHYEGLHAWMVRMCGEALTSGKVVSEADGRTIVYCGMRFCFEIGNEWPVLKTIMPVKRKKRT